MIKDRLTLGLSTMVLLFGLGACSSEPDETGDTTPTVEDDRREIEATLAETAVRWRYGDKAVLYDQEFEYARVEYTYDAYLEIDRIKRMESDTVETFRVGAVKFFGRDSALVSVDVVFVGPTRDTTHLPQEWMMYNFRGRWIRPTMSSWKYQIQYEEIRRQADSAAAAESENDDW